MIDLGKWGSEAYRVADEGEPEGPADAADQPDLPKAR
jgi:endogenous inhibitor of DNA gyrase (YacG/DUF329 family)